MRLFVKSMITKRSGSRTPTMRPVTTLTGRAAGLFVDGTVVAVTVRFGFADLAGCGSGLLHAAVLSRAAKNSIVEGYDIGRAITVCWVQRQQLRQRSGRFVQIKRELLACSMSVS